MPRRSDGGRLDPRLGPQNLFERDFGIHDSYSCLSIGDIAWVRLCTQRTGRVRSSSLRPEGDVLPAPARGAGRSGQVTS